MRLALLVALAAACRSPDGPAPVKKETAPAPAPVVDAAPPVRAPQPTTTQVPGPDQPVVSFGGASVFGSESFVILPTGSASETIRRPGKPDEVKNGMLSPAELRRLHDDLAAASCCSLASKRTVGVPDEGHTNLNVGFMGLVCSVSLWDNEWHELPAAAACAKLLDRFRKRLR
jgi:hypothetical protein